LFYLGHVYGSKPKLPLWFKHFDSGQDGAGEAYHLGSPPTDVTLYG